MYKFKLKLLIEELKMISPVCIFEKIILNRFEKEYIFDHIKLKFAFIFFEDYIELFELYVDLYCCSFSQQLPFMIIQKLIGQIKQCPTIHHNYLILKILEKNFKLDQYTIIVNNIAQSQKLLGLCVILTNKKIKQITKQILKVIIPIIYQLPLYQISFHGIIEQQIEQQRQIQKIDDQIDFFYFTVQPNIQYFQKFHLEKIIDYCFYLLLNKKDYQKKNLEGFDSNLVYAIYKLAINSNLFKQDDKYYKEIQNNLHSNDPIYIRNCLQLLDQNEFNHNECLLISDKQIMQIYLNNLKYQSQYSHEIMQLLSKILLNFYPCQVQRLLLNNKHFEILLDFMIKKNFRDFIRTPHLRLIEILFQKNCVQAYNQHCPQLLMLFLECLNQLNQGNKKTLLLIIGIICDILNKVPPKRILANRKIFRTIINQIDKFKSMISIEQYDMSYEKQINFELQLIISKIFDLDITQQIFRKTFFEKWFRY